MPVGTRARSPGARVTSTAVTRSAPASPGWAYAGSGSSGSSRRTATSRSGWWGSDTRRTLPLRHARARPALDRADVRRAAGRPAAVVGPGGDAARDVLARVRGGRPRGAAVGRHGGAGTAPGAGAGLL